MLENFEARSGVMGGVCVGADYRLDDIYRKNFFRSFTKSPCGFYHESEDTAILRASQLFIPYRLVSSPSEVATSQAEAAEKAWWRHS